MRQHDQAADANADCYGGRTKEHHYLKDAHEGVDIESYDAQGKAAIYRTKGRP
jgi:hypothetical protein